MKRLTFILGMLMALVPFLNGQIIDRGRIRQDVPTIYIDYLCQSKQVILLRFVNNTSWHIDVSSGQYFPTKRPITLLNGVKTFAAPNDEPITSLFYHIEIDELSGISKGQIPKSARKGIGIEGGGAWIAPADSIFFPVPAEYLKKGLKVTVRFKYEWEIPKDGHRINDPDHRVYFRGINLPNSSLACSSGLEKSMLKKELGP